MVFGFDGSFVKRSLSCVFMKFNGCLKFAASIIVQLSYFNVGIICTFCSLGQVLNTQIKKIFSNTILYSS